MNKELEGIARDYLYESLLERDDSLIFAEEALSKLGTLGLFNNDFSNEKDLLQFSERIKLLTKNGLDVPFCLSLVAHAIGIEVIKRFGSKELQQSLSSLQRADSLLAICNSEMSGGTDLKNMISELRRNEDHYLLSARKYCISNLPKADWVLLSALYNENGKTRFKVVATEVKESDKESMINELIGFKTGLTGSLSLDNHRVDVDSILNESGNSLDVLNTMFNLERLLIPSICEGLLERILEDALNFSSTKKTFNTPIIKNQFIQEKILIIYKNIMTIKSVGKFITNKAYEVSWHSVDAELSIYKYDTIDSTLEALQNYKEICGAKSYMNKDYVSKAFRDISAFLNLGGTKELHKMRSIRNIILDKENKEHETQSTQRPRELKAI